MSEIIGRKKPLAFEGKQKDKALPQGEKLQEKRDEEIKNLISEVKEKYPDELKEIIGLANKTGFKKLIIEMQDKMRVSLIEPELISVPADYFKKSGLPKAVIPEYFGKGLEQMFLKARRFADEKWKKEIWQKIFEIRDKIKLKEMTDKGGEKEIKKLKESLEIEKDFSKILSEEEVESEVIRDHIENILSASIKDTENEMNAWAMIFSLRESRPNDTRLLSRYQKTYTHLYKGAWDKYKERHPRLSNETIDDLASKYIRIGEDIGKKYLEYIESKKKKPK